MVEIRKTAKIANELIMDIIQKSSSSKIDFHALIALLKELLHTKQVKTGMFSFKIKESNCIGNYQLDKASFNKLPK